MRQFVARGQDQLKALADLILGLSPEKPWRVQLTPHKSRRSNDANAYLWALYAEIAKGTGHTSEEIHEALKSLLLPKQIIRIGDAVVHTRQIPGYTGTGMGLFVLGSQSPKAHIHFDSFEMKVLS